MLPAKLQRTLDAFAFFTDRSERIQALISIAERFRPVADAVAKRPYPETAKVPACESEAYCFPVPRQDGTLDFHFAVDNPQGISARAMAVVLAESLSGAPLVEVVAVPGDLPTQLFGPELSMGKTMGLTGMVAMAKVAAQRALTRDNPAP